MSSIITTQCLLRRSLLGVGHNCRLRSPRRGLMQWSKLHALQKNRKDILSVGRLWRDDGEAFSSTPMAGKKLNGTVSSPLEKLAGSMEEGLGPGKLGVVGGPDGIPELQLPHGVQALTTNATELEFGRGNVSDATAAGDGNLKAEKLVREEIKSEEKNEKSEEKGEETKKTWFKPISDKVVGYWLLGSAGLVFGIVVLGGLTRLTESGLSITEWKPVTGSIPPLNQAHWEEEFAKYKDSPEYRILNPNMTLEEFKFIYYMEWTHRLWGRVIGLSFVIPAAYFIARGRVSGKIAARLVGISGLIGFQGFIGWWMVKSGLKDDLFTTPGNSVPRVSQYRLTAHLCAAFTVYLAMLYNGLKILRAHRLVSNPVLAQTEFKLLLDPRLRPLRRTVWGLATLAFITAMSGGLVAGLDAGLIYNDFPKMGTGYKPPNSELFNAFYARDKENHSDLWWRNLLENPSTVQFQHRCLAMTTFTSIVGFWLWARYGRVGSPQAAIKIWDLLNRKMRMGVNGALHLVLFQVTLGISTLIYMVPTPLAAAHQAGSLALLTGIVVLGVRVSPAPQRAVVLVSQHMKDLMGMGTGIGMGPGAAAAVAGLRGASAAEIGSLANIGSGVSPSYTGNVLGREALRASRECVETHHNQDTNTTRAADEPQNNNYSIKRPSLVRAYSVPLLANKENTYFSKSSQQSSPTPAPVPVRARLTKSSKPSRETAIYTPPTIARYTPPIATYTPPIATYTPPTIGQKQDQDEEFPRRRRNRTPPPGSPPNSYSDTQQKELSPTLTIRRLPGKSP